MGLKIFDLGQNLARRQGQLFSNAGNKQMSATQDRSFKTIKSKSGFFQSSSTLPAYRRFPGAKVKPCKPRRGSGQGSCQGGCLGGGVRSWEEGQGAGPRLGKGTGVGSCGENDRLSTIFDPHRFFYRWLCLHDNSFCFKINKDLCFCHHHHHHIIGNATDIILKYYPVFCS